MPSLQTSVGFYLRFILQETDLEISEDAVWTPAKEHLDAHQWIPAQKQT